MGLYSWLITGRWHSLPDRYPPQMTTGPGVPNPHADAQYPVVTPSRQATTLTNPYEKPETDTARVHRRLRQGLCPDCNSTYFYKGARTGSMQNIECAKCGHKFNIGYVDEYTIIAERIGLIQ